MSPWLFNVFMDGVVREVNIRVLSKGLELQSANGGRFKVNRLLFADDTEVSRQGMTDDTGENWEEMFC